MSENRLYTVQFGGSLKIKATSEAHALREASEAFYCSGTKISESKNFGLRVLGSKPIPTATEAETKTPTPAEILVAAEIPDGPAGSEREACGIPGEAIWLAKAVIPDAPETGAPYNLYLKRDDVIGSPFIVTNPVLAKVWSSKEDCQAELDVRHIAGFVPILGDANSFLKDIEEVKRLSKLGFPLFC